MVAKEAKKKGWSVNEVAKRAGITSARLYRWNDVNPMVKNIIDVADALNISPTELMPSQIEITNPDTYTPHERSIISAAHAAELTEDQYNIVMRTITQFNEINHHGEIKSNKR